MQYALAAEPVQSPEQHQIKLPLGRRRKQIHEGLPVTPLAAGVVNVLLYDYVSLPLTELPELPELILDVLATVPGAHAAVDGCAG